MSKPIVNLKTLLKGCAFISEQTTHRQERNNSTDSTIVVRHPTVGVLRLSVHLDRSYDFQSNAHADVWTAAGWTTVHRIHPELVKNVDVTLAELARVALAVLGS